MIFYIGWYLQLFKQWVKYEMIAGITHVFHALTFAGPEDIVWTRSCLGQVFKLRPRDPASVNAMKQTCSIDILAYFTWFQPKLRWKRRLNINISLFLHTLDFCKQNGVSVKFSNVITLPQRHGRAQRFRKRNQWRNNQLMPQYCPV